MVLATGAMAAKQDKEAKCNIDECLTSFKALPDREYTVTDHAMIFTMADISTEECPLTYSFSVSDSKILQSISLTGRHFKVEDLYDLSLTQGKDYFDYEVEVMASMGDDCVKAEASFNLRIKNPCIDPKYVKVVDTSGLGLESI